MELSPEELEGVDSKVAQKPLDLRLPLDLRAKFKLQQEEQLEQSLLSDAERARRALEQYEELERKDPFSVKSDAVAKTVRKTPDTASQPESRGFQFDLNSKGHDWSQSMYDYNPHMPDQKGQQAKMQIDRKRQRTFDRIADMIYPGFGRIEFKIGDSNARLDYLNARRCKGLKGVGLCLQIGLR